MNNNLKEETSSSPLRGKGLKQYKTNIMCGYCIAKVTPVLNEVLGESHWEVDIKDPKKVLTVSTEVDNEANIIEALKKIGYKAEELK